MKAVIVEIRNNFAAALTDDGCIVKVPNKNYAIGQVIEMKKQISKKSKLVGMVASAAAAVVLCSLTAWAYFTPYTYVSVDVNPSVEYAVNMFDRVLSADAVNDDGETILQDLNLENTKIEDAIAQTVGQIAENGYFNDEAKNAVMITTSGTDEQKAETLATELKEVVANKVSESSPATETTIEAISVGKERVLKAKELGVTPGKLNLVEKLMASAEKPEDINIEEWLQKPVKEIMKATKENRQALKEKDKDDADDNDDDDADENDKEDADKNDEAKDAAKDAVKDKAKVEKPEKANNKPIDKTTVIEDLDEDDQEEIKANIPANNKDTITEDDAKKNDMSNGKSNQKGKK